MRNSKTRLFALIYYNRLTTLPYHRTIECVIAKQDSLHWYIITDWQHCRTIILTVGLDSEKALVRVCLVVLTCAKIYIPFFLPLASPTRQLCFIQFRSKYITASCRVRRNGRLRCLTSIDCHAREYMRGNTWEHSKSLILSASCQTHAIWLKKKQVF